MDATLRLAAVLELLDNTTTAEALGARHGVSVAEVEAWRSLYVAGLRQASSGQAPLQRRARTGLKVGLLAAGVGLLVGGAAWAQLTTFQPDQPARATQVNANFTFLKDWIERKVGPLTGTSGPDPVRIGSTQDVGTLGTQGALVVGATGGANLGVDGNEIQARSGNGTSSLTLNGRGGTVFVTGELNAGTLSAASVKRSGGARILSAAGPLPLAPSFTTSGGQVLLFLSGSGFGTGGTIVGMNVTVDGTQVATVDAYTNETSSHKAFVTRLVQVGRLSSGAHTVRLTAMAGTATDLNDRFEVSYLELP